MRNPLKWWFDRWLDRVARERYERGPAHRPTGEQLDELEERLLAQRAARRGETGLAPTRAGKR